MENDPMLASLIDEALAKGLPMPLNWVVDEDLSDSSSYDDDEESDQDNYSDDYSDYDESDQDEDLDEDSDSPDAQESEQADDDPEDKEVRDDCGSQTTEDCHGGNEATRSVEDSPSVAENGQEDRDSDQTENNGEDGDGEGEDGQSGETTHSSENGQNSGENGSGSGEGGEEGTSSDSDGGQGGSGGGGTLTRNSDEEENRDTSEGKNNQTAWLLKELEKQKAESLNPRAIAWKQAEELVIKTIIHICEQDCGIIKNAPTSWDTRAMSRDVAIGRWDRVLRDKKWSHRTKNLVIFWDQSGSCDSYIDAVHNALKTVAGLGYRCTLFDASNGIEMDTSVVWTITKSKQTTNDPYRNGPRLREVAKELKIRTDKNIICPNKADFIKICEKADVVIVLQDYDCVQPLFEAASKVSRRKCPHYIDLEMRYYEPYEHNWNPNMFEGQQYPVPDRWHRIWDVRGDDDEY